MHSKYSNDYATPLVYLHVISLYMYNIFSPQVKLTQYPMSGTLPCIALLVVVVALGLPNDVTAFRWTSVDFDTVLDMIDDDDDRMILRGRDCPRCFCSEGECSSRLRDECLSSDDSCCCCMHGNYNCLTMSQMDGYGRHSGYNRNSRFRGQYRRRGESESSESTESTDEYDD